MAIGKRILESIQEVVDHEKGLPTGVRVSTVEIDRIKVKTKKEKK